ncbi:hypothetical protein [Arthrobacter nitrophenolicus]|uniref:Uncharacterized protein n=2 Tax=Arthrobacter nitrophenolicus TaxID=683150 RepID=A0ACC6THR1_9MICC|nr:hypothetical protein [Arthrobacter nitrophenolicus]ELT43214.1 hypothetical protein G205_19743 [Arthrobacter nitrophenolicus]
MSRIEALNRRYAASSSLIRNGVEILAVGDPVGARLNAACRWLMFRVGEDGPELWDDLLGSVKSLRWRLMTQPQPLDFNPALRDGASEVFRQTHLLRGAVVEDALLDELAAAAAGVSAQDPVLGDVLLRSVQEVGATDCVVVAANASARAAMGEWLRPLGINVLTVSALRHVKPGVEQSYAVGPPRYFGPSLVNAPVTDDVTFLMPAWFRDRQIPCSVLTPYAEGAIRVRARLFLEGDLAEPALQGEGKEDFEEEFLPQPVWGSPRSPDREPLSDEVEARKLLLSGNRGLWLDNGERIRAIDPEQPIGERVVYIDVESVRVGTYLLLREGETEHEVLYDAALSRLGDHCLEVAATQEAWKERLQRRLSQLGRSRVEHELRSAGVRTVERAPAWREPHLVRPQSDQDFEKLLQWLDLPVQPSFGNATLLRREIYRTIAQIREQLEAAVSAADLSVLERDGHLSLDVESAGFRGILAARVIAISPQTEIIPRNEARVPFDDWSGKWLE